MDKKTSDILKNIINKTISREYDYASENFDKILDTNKELAKKHNEYLDKADAILKKIIDLVPDEYKKPCDDLIDEMLGAEAVASSIETEMLFKEGVISGIYKLNYLGEVGSIIYFS